MPKSVIMLAMIKQMLNHPDMEKDCQKFDDWGNPNAAFRIRQRLVKIRKMCKKMRHEVLEMDVAIKYFRGYSTHRGENYKIRAEAYVKKNNIKELPKPRRKPTNVRKRD